MTSARPGLLRNRVASLCSLVFCTYMALPQSARSLRSTGELGPHGRDPIFVFGLVASLVITSLIATRSPFVGDRVVFGAAAGVFLSGLIKAVLSPSPLALAATVINVIVSLLWAVAAIASLVILISALRRRPRSR